MPLSELCFNGYHDACYEIRQKGYQIVDNPKPYNNCNCPCHKGVKIK